MVTLEGLAIGDVEESGVTFEENARLKALSYSAHAGELTLADDSGLEVEALGGEPGVRSARYAGEGASDSQRVSYLLSRLEDIPWERRAARFRCVIAVATPAGQVEFSYGECRGFITLEPRGTGGFGYDPVFYLPEYGLTVAELPPEVKNRVSHRARAAAGVREALGRLDVL
jgi:XTP/dITP diphosphohydrolase